MLTVFVLCVVVCVVEGASKDALGFQYVRFSREDRARLVLSGSALLSPPQVLLTANISGGLEAGAMWHGKRVWINEFVCNFSFLIPTFSKQNGDGVALVFFNVPGASPTPKSVVLEAGSLGYGSGLEGEDEQGLPGSVAVEFDSHYDETLGDPELSHIGVHSRGGEPNSANESCRLGDVAEFQGLRGRIQSATVTYRKGQLEVLMNAVNVLTVKMDLIGELQGESEVFLGLSASSVGDLHSILSWSFAYTGNQLDPSRCRVFGVGWSTLNVTAGVDETFYITAVDLYNHSFFGRPPVFYALIGDLSAPAVVLPNDPSTYSVTYHGTQAGLLTLQVFTFSDELVAETQTRCVPGPLDPAASRLGGAWRGGTVGQLLAFTVIVTDGYNNTVTPSSNPIFEFDFSPSGPVVQHQTCGACKGVYPFQISCQAQGVFNMTLKVNKQVVVGSPFKVSFSSGAVAPEHATVEGDGVSGGAVGIPIVVLVQLRDQFSNPVSASANVTLTVASANKTLINAIVNASSVPGRYMAVWNTTVAGWYSYVVRVNGISSSESPITFVRVSPLAVASPQMSQLLWVSGSRVGVPNIWKAVGLDVYGNVLTVVPEFELKMSGSVSGPMNFSSVPYGPGTMMMYVIPTMAETIEVFVSLVGVPVKGSPFSFSVQIGAVSALTSVAHGLENSVVASALQSFSLDLRDDFGSAIASGDVAVIFSPPAHSVSVTANTVSYELSPGTYVLSVTPLSGPWKGVPLSNSFPFYIVARSESGASVELVSAVAMLGAAVISLVVLLVLVAYRKKLTAPPTPDPQDEFANTTFEDEDGTN